MTSSPSCSNSLLLILALALLLCLQPRAAGAEEHPLPTIALFPLENLSGTPAPLAELGGELSAAMEKRGLKLVPSATMGEFIDRQHLRYLGGIDEKTADRLKRQTGADAVLITTLELYTESFPPKFALISRLVRLQGIPEIVWMDSVGIAGDDAPGFLGLGTVRDIGPLTRKGINAIAASLRAATDTPLFHKRLQPTPVGREEEPFTLLDLIRGIRKERPQVSVVKPEPPETVEELVRRLQAGGGLFLSRYAPLDWYVSAIDRSDREPSVAIIPFFNRSTRKNAAELQGLHLARQLVANGRFRVLEPGVIRDKMLSMHVIMTDGISIPSMDLITISLGVDLLLNGLIFDYLDTVGTGAYPKVDFSMQMYERDSKKILWSSHSHNQGDDGVFFFDFGRISTAAALADKMCRALVLKLVDTVRQPSTKASPP